MHYDTLQSETESQKRGVLALKLAGHFHYRLMEEYEMIDQHPP